MHRRTRQIWRALGALLVLVITVVGVPVALVAFVGWPLPTSAPTIDEFSRVLTRGDVSTSSLIKALSVAVWLAWLQLAAAILTEAVGVARGRRARRVPSPRPLRMAAANLVTTAAMLLSSPVRPAVATNGDVPDLGAALVLRADPADAPNTGPSPPMSPLATPATGPEAVDGHPSGTGDAPTWIVGPRDTLWDIAERTLGDGLRWTDIQRLNVGRPQPDGRALQPDDDFVAPGWKLHLPADASLPDEPATPRETNGDATGTTTSDFVTVDPGDTLWDLSEQHLGDPLLWLHLYAANQGRLQTDGRRLTDPDVILPGWRLNLPASDVRPAGNPPPSRGSTVRDAPTAHEGGTRDDVRDVDAPSAVQPRGVEAPGAAEPASPEVQPGSQTGYGSDEPGATVPWSGIVTVVGAGLIAAGIAATLDRIRRARRRRRPAGRRISLPEGRGAQIELGVRGVADEKTARYVQHAIGQVQAHREHLDGPIARRIVLVSTSATELALHLARPGHEPPDGWGVTDDGHTWVTSPALMGKGERPAPGTGGGPSLLVSLGTAAEGRRRVQLNLAHVGMLVVEAEPDQRRTALLGFAVELATAMTTCHPRVICVGFGSDLAALEWVEENDDPEEVVKIFERQADEIGRHPDVDVRDIQPIVALFRGPADPSVVDRLRSAVDRGEGRLAAVVAGTAEAVWVLRMHRGRWRLLPVGVELLPLELEGEELERVGELVRMAKDGSYVAAPDLDGPATITGDPPSSDVGEADRVEPSPVSEDPAGDADADAGDHPEVRILRAVEVAGVDRWPTAKSKEAVVYLATHGGGADADTLMEALWPRQEPNRNRLQTEISRARHVLGDGPEGEPYLPPARRGVYRLDPRVRTDFARFRSLVRDATRRPDDAIALLQDALDLVGNRPWSATPAGCYSWAEFERHAVEQSVADAAHELAHLCLDVGQPSEAISAARKGLLADDHYEGLYRDLMRAAAASGNTAEIHRIMEELRDLLACETGANDADDWMDPETVRLFEELTTPRGGARPIEDDMADTSATQ